MNPSDLAPRPAESAVAGTALAGDVPDPTRPGGGPELAGVLETMPAAFCFVDRSWRFRYVNAHAERLMDVPRAELLGRCMWEAYPGTLGGRYEAAFREAVDSGEPVAFEGPYPGCPDGWYEIRAWPGPEGLAIYFLDVTDRHRAEQASRTANERITLLGQVNAELSGALDGESALGRLARLVVPTLTDACIVTVVDRHGHPRDVGSWHADPARRALLERYTHVRLESMPPASPLARALRTGTPITESVERVLALMPAGEPRDLLGALAPATATVLPLAADGHGVGVLTLYQDPGRRTSEQDLVTAREVAAQAGRAVDRVHRQSQQAQLAEALQRSLLTEPPAIDTAEIVVRYVPAAEAARVGGDWYDAFLQRDGNLVTVIGDVVGHDTAAAAAMGQLRALLRGIAHHSGAGPAEVLRGLDEAIASMHTGTMATAAVARFECAPDGAGTVLRWANAGHPPPVLLRSDGAVTVLGGDRADLMLGVEHGAGRREPVVDVPPGASVLLYTDGLVERRGSTLDAGLGRLLDHLAEFAGTPLPELCDHVLDHMLQGTPQDDVALVAVRPRPAAQR